MLGAAILTVLTILVFHRVLKKALAADRHSDPRKSGIDHSIRKQLADYAERVARFHD